LFAISVYRWRPLGSSNRKTRRALYAPDTQLGCLLIRFISSLSNPNQNPIPRSGLHARSPRDHPVALFFRRSQQLGSDRECALMTNRHFETRRPDRPPIHFSLQDPWRDYRLRLSQHYAANAFFQPSALFVPRVVVEHPSYPFGQTAAALEDDLDNLATRPIVSSTKRINKEFSKYRGAVWDFSCRLWRSRIKVKGKTWYLGLFKDIDSAAMTYDAAAYFVYGRGAKLNFPSTDYSKTPPPRAPPAWLMEYLRQVKIDTRKTKMHDLHSTD